MRFLVTKYEEVVTERSARDGEAESCETLYEDREMGFRELVDELEGMCELSAGPIRDPEDCRGTWAISEGSIDQRTGDSSTESVHVRQLNGYPAKGRQLYRLYRAAGLVAR